MPTKNTQTTETNEQNEVAVQETAPAETASFLDGVDLSGFEFSAEELQELTGLDAIDSSEIRIPYATLFAKPKGQYKAGDIVFPDGTVIHGADGEVAHNIAVLKPQPTRVYFPVPFKAANGFICRSLDGQVGAPDGEYAGQPCDTCEFSKYPKDGGASPCRDQRLLLCTREDGLLFHLNVSGISVKEWKAFMSTHAFRLLPVIKKKLGAEVLGAINITLGAKIEETENGPFGALVMTVEKGNEFHSMERINANLTAYKSYKAFEKEHVASSTMQVQREMAVAEGEQTEQKNRELF